MDFWSSDIGEITGKAEDAFSKSFGLIPNDTIANAQIDKFEYQEFMGNKFLQINWKITAGDFKNRLVFQKLHVFDQDSKKRHKGLNMLLYIFKLLGHPIPEKSAPTPSELARFVGNTAQIRIQETEPNAEGKQYNFVSEIHTKDTFENHTGTRLVSRQSASQKGFDDRAIESAFSRYENNKNQLNDDIPF